MPTTVGVPVLRLKGESLEEATVERNQDSECGVAYGQCGLAPRA